MNTQRIGDMVINEDSSEKTITLDFISSKKLILVLVLIALAVIAVGLFASPVLKINHQPVEVSLLVRIEWFLLITILFLAGCFLFWKKHVIVLKVKADGSLCIETVSWFYRKKNFTIDSAQRPQVIGRRCRMIGFTFYVGSPIYEPIIRYDENGSPRDISLIFPTAYFMKGIGPRGVLSKEQLQEISKQLNLPLTFEE